MAKKERDASELPVDLIGALDPMLRDSVRALLMDDANMSFEAAVRKTTQWVADGIIAKAEERGPQTQGSARSEAITGLPPGSKVIVRRCIGGEFTYGGRTLDRNQVFELTGLRNDDALVRLGYVEGLKPGARLETCGECGGQFSEAASATAHYKRRHVAVPVERLVFETQRRGETKEEYEQRERAWREAMVAEEEARTQREELAEQQRAPLYLDQTKASRA